MLTCKTRHGVTIRMPDMSGGCISLKSIPNT